MDWESFFAEPVPEIGSLNEDPELVQSPLVYFVSRTGGLIRDNVVVLRRDQFHTRAKQRLGPRFSYLNVKLFNPKEKSASFLVRLGDSDYEPVSFHKEHSGIHRLRLTISSRQFDCNKRIHAVLLYNGVRHPFYIRWWKSAARRKLRIK